MLGQSALGMLIDGGRASNRAAQGERVLRQFAELNRIAAEDGVKPRFVFAHIPSPHGPYVLDEQCQVRAETDL